MVDEDARENPVSDFDMMDIKPEEAFGRAESMKRCTDLMGECCRGVMIRFHTARMRD